MKLLIVDDHPMFLDGLTQGLKQLDGSLELEQAANAEQALAKIEKGPRPEFLLIDIVLPRGSGLGLLRDLVKRDIWIPTLVLSAFEEPELVVQALDSGAMGFVPKTFSAQQLLDAIETVLRGDLFLPPQIADQLDRHLGDHETGHDDVAGRYGITRRQTEVLKLMTRGYSNKKIASALFVSEHTVKSHVKAMFKALKVANRTACVKKAEQLGLVPPSSQIFD